MAQATIDLEMQDTAALWGDRVICTTPYGRLPLFVAPADPGLGEDLDILLGWIDNHREALERALLDHGAVVFRGFPISTTDDFARFIDLFPAHQQGYAAGAALRKGIKGRVMESTRMAAEANLPLHQEMSYLRDNPRLVAFFSRIVAETGGETTIADMRRVTDGLSRDLFEKFKSIGVRYTRNLLSPDVTDRRTDPAFSHNNWVANFNTDDREAVEQSCRERDLTAEWLPDGSLNMHNDRPGVIAHPTTGEPLYFNQAHAQIQRHHAYGKEAFARVEEVYGADLPRAFDSTFANGSRITDAELDEIYGAIDRASVSFPWRPGDIMIVENKLTAHGRQPYTGVRAVEVALID